MKSLNKFLKNRDGSIAIQFSIVMFPLLALGGVGIDYSRVAVVKTNLQSTLDQNIITMHPSDFSNRAEMERYIVALAGVNLDSKTVSADISINKNVMRVDLRDTVKTPVMGFIGKSEVEVLASIDIKYPDQTSTTTATTGNAGSNSSSNRSVPQYSRTQINKAKRKILSQIDRIRAYKYYSPAQKQRAITRLRNQLQKLKQL